MSDLGNRGWTNSMKLGEDIDLDKRLQDPVSFVFILSSFILSSSHRGGSYFGVLEYRKQSYESKLSSTTITISNGNRTEWSTIQGVIVRVISNRPSAQREADLKLRA